MRGDILQKLQNSSSDACTKFTKFYIENLYKIGDENPS